MMTKLLHKKLLLASLLLISVNSYAGKFDFLTGMYSFSGKVGSRSSSISGFGVYEGSYLVPFNNQFEFVAGYSFTMTGVIGGDYSYGPKLGLNYFPVTYSGRTEIQLDRKSIVINELLKPYVGISFNQRQYQSIKTSYAGLGISAGCEKYINDRITLKGELKLNSYSGPSNSTASEMNILAGLVFDY